MKTFLFIRPIYQFYFLILLNAIQIYSSFLDKIPSKFISDQNFIDMTLNLRKNLLFYMPPQKGAKIHVI